MTSSRPLVSVVIPAYNRRDSVLALLTDVFAQDYPALEVLVVDDKSPDDTAEAIAARFPAVKLLRNERNSGPAVSRNRGVQAAAGAIVVGFDSDVTLPDRNLISQVVDTFARHPKATGLAFRLFTPDGKEDDWPRWWHPVPIKQFAAKSFESDYFSGTGYAFRRESMIAAGLFPEILYMHYEEVELAYRILDAGGSILYCPDLRVVHHAHPVSTRSKIKTFYKPRNQILVAVACYPWIRAASYLVPRMGYHFLQSIRYRHVGEFFSALVSAWRLAPQRLATRMPLSRETWQRMAGLRRYSAEVAQV